jgi:hypothetical protein
VYSKNWFEVSIPLSARRLKALHIVKYQKAHKYRQFPIHGEISPALQRPRTHSWFYHSE